MHGLRSPDPVPWRSSCPVWKVTSLDKLLKPKMHRVAGVVWNTSVTMQDMIFQLCLGKSPGYFGRVWQISFGVILATYWQMLRNYITCNNFNIFYWHSNPEISGACFQPILCKRLFMILHPQSQGESRCPAFCSMSSRTGTLRLPNGSLAEKVFWSKTEICKSCRFASKPHRIHGTGIFIPIYLHSVHFYGKRW